MSSTAVEWKFCDKNKTFSQISAELERAGVQTVQLHQVHGRTVHKIQSPKDVAEFLGKPPQGDALVTGLPQVALSVHTADCLPVLAWESKIIGACHAGWRGVAGDVLESWIEAMIDMGASASSLQIRIGPSIGKCHFEVGNDVAQKFGLDSDSSPLFLHENPEKKYVDLKAAAIMRLENIGVPRPQIQASDECTYCDERYYSYRRDQKTGRRQEAIIFRAR